MSFLRISLLLFLGAALLVAQNTATVWSAPASAGPISVTARLTQSSLRVGDQVGLQVAVTHPHQAVVEFPDLHGKLGFLEEVRFQRLPANRSLDGTQVTTGEYIITGFIPGKFNVPPVTITYMDPEGVKNSATSNGDLVLDVTSVLSPTEEESLRDIKPPLAIGRDPYSYASTAALAALALSTAALAGIFARRATRRSSRMGLEVLDLTPETLAREELDHIGELGLVPQGRYAQYCGLISTAVRRYLDSRFSLDTSASTTMEIRATALNQALDAWQARVVVGLLEECDAVRWAQYHPNPQRVERLLTMAYEIVDLTSRSPLPHSEASQGAAVK